MQRQQLSMQSFCEIYNWEKRMKRAMVLAGLAVALVVSVAYAADPKLVISAAENNMVGTSTNVTVTLTDGAFNFNNSGSEVWIDGVKLMVPPNTVILNQVRSYAVAAF